MTQTHKTRPCVSHASESACLMTLTEEGARSTAHKICLNTPGSTDRCFVQWARSDWTVGPRDNCRSHRTDRTRRPVGASSPDDNHIGKDRFGESQNLGARVSLPDRCSGAAILRIDSDERLPQLRHHFATLERTETSWSHDTCRNDNVKRPEFRAPRARDSVRPRQRVHGQRRQIHRAENVT